ncbi:Uncharacterized 7.7 kDa protein in gp5-gp4 intergenic region [Xenorhabdus bovienii str. oregonense]|uniref:Uncharacterized 7.7 kDa protein in gp5-gp4 intergenic region n=1 Tax=Xenorhabdus bovienii str. oregonense TaxID=1398202 RepID=A0A077P4D3_XENBV|nr:hypothetical protein [Xenorhabdus bovienii]CDH05438.1 Uncharacterized 7.7 kDa protein in gp5-gp4 intergenic region [Xenorhabdus bovienii str. oregonense]
MQKMLYKPDGEVNVWGMMLQITVIEPEELDEYLADGWVEHPNDTLKTEPVNLGKGKKNEPNNQG